VIIHTREAEEETIEILRAEWALQICLASCIVFSGSARLAAQSSGTGSGNLILGVLTFKKAQDLRDIARQVPSEQLLIETDCSLPGAGSFRGKRNEPAYVVEVARCIAEVREWRLKTWPALRVRTFARVCLSQQPNQKPFHEITRSNTKKIFVLLRVAALVFFRGSIVLFTKPGRENKKIVRL